MYDPIVQTIGTLIIPSGSNISSNYLSQSVYSRLYDIAFFATSSISGTITLQGSATPTDSASWCAVQGYPPGVTITITPGKITTLVYTPFEGLRLSSSVAPTVNEGIIVQGQFLVAATGLAPFAQ